ncbi:LysR family transcriptional regulator [Belnapia sp. T6]|uniref:LysR family transcriptional regulator n=1 Tax=Belnapia mucosa TaxID=2804532 RepID=A0ABS1VDF4_9PROT|nr:LysR family transcriptional regulator [Belnapia mucosa]MBL6458764.1 LysR family transcriptional regulator [Belnapia mucosa]
MHQLRYAIAASRTLSFTRAAEQCHVTQPALTAAVKKLEVELGGALFHRERNRLRLTEFGRQMEPLLAGVLERAEAARGVAESLRLLNQPPVRVGVMPTLGPMRLSVFLADFERAHPGVEVAIREGRPSELATWLEADTLDAAILNPLDAPAEGWRTEPLYTERYVVLLPADHPLRAKDALALGDLAGHPYVDRLACEMRERVLAVCGQRGVELYARYRSEREDWVQAMVAAKLGFAFMPEHSITHPGAIQRPLTDPVVERQVALVTMPGRPQAPAVAAFLRAARTFRWLG